MSGVTKERFLVTKGDYAVLPAGIKVISCPNGNCKGAGVTFPDEARSGMLVFYKNTDFLSVDPSATPTVGPLVFGMFNDSQRNGRVDEIIKIAGEKLSCNGFLSLRADPAVEGQEEVSRYMYKCVKKGNLYKLFVEIESDRTHKEFFKNRKARLVGQYMQAEDACVDGCDDDANARQIACGLVDSLNGGYKPVIDNLFMQGWPAPADHKREPNPIKAFVYNPTTYHFCLDGSTDGCNGCTNVTGVKGVKIEGVTYLFSGLLNSTTTSHESQVKQLIELINCKFDKHQGFAWRESGTFGSTCLSFGIAVNSCKTVDGLVKYDDTIIAPCSTEEHTFTKKAPDLPCINCGGSADADITYNGVIGFVGDLAEENCTCDGFTDNPVSYYPTHVTAWGEGFVDGTFEVIQKAIIPQNWGRQLWNDEYMADVRPGYMTGQMRTGGKWNNLLDDARSKGMLTDCSIPYCVITWMNYSGGHNAGGYATGDFRANIVRNTIAVPKTNTTTIAAIIADLNALKNAGDCQGEILDISCTPDAEPGPPTPTPTRTPDATPSVTPTITATQTQTPTVTVSVTATKTPTVTPSISITGSVTPTVTTSVSITPSPSA